MSFQGHTLDSNPSLRCGSKSSKLGRAWTRHGRLFVEQLEERRVLSGSAPASVVDVPSPTELPSVVISSNVTANVTVSDQWYAFEPLRSAAVLIDATLPNSGSSLSVTLYDATGNVLGNSSAAGLESLHASYLPSGGQRYLVQVSGNNSAEVAHVAFRISDADACDTNRDGSVGAADLLRIINALNSVGVQATPTTSDDPKFYLDANLDGTINARDLLHVINYLLDADHSPVAGNDQAITPTGHAVTVNALANDTDPDGGALTIIAAAQASHGTVELRGDSTISYTSQAGFVGVDTFIYLVRDAKGATGTGKVSVNVEAANDWPAHVYAPFVDMTLDPTMYDLVSAAQTQGLRYYSLAFIVADSKGQPSWGGDSQNELGTSFDAQLKTQISTLRAGGGDVVVSFGGAAGQELAQSITGVQALARAYQSVIDAYGLTHVDFDIEGPALADHASIDRRNQAIAVLQTNAATAGKPLNVSYTLPVLPTGLTPDGLYLVQSAARNGVDVGLVNVLALDFGDAAAPAPQGHMGDYAIQAANSTFSQLKGVYGTAKADSQLWQMIGVTAMIGLNDELTETFGLQDAAQLVAFAEQTGLGRIAIWSLSRDQQNPAGILNFVDNESSSILQQPFQFSQIFRPFTA